MPSYDRNTKKQPVTMTIRADVLKEARDLNLNTSQAAENGIALAVKKEKEIRWLEENKPALDAYNEYIKASGLPMKPYWMNEDGSYGPF